MSRNGALTIGAAALLAAAGITIAVLLFSDRGAGTRPADLPAAAEGGREHGAEPGGEAGPGSRAVTSSAAPSPIRSARHAATTGISGRVFDEEGAQRALEEARTALEAALALEMPEDRPEVEPIGLAFLAMTLAALDRGDEARGVLKRARSVGRDAPVEVRMLLREADERCR